ncbi:MAG: hypothetical protein Q9159_001310 [Coniocarpon cinnabarinum]
MASPRTFSAHDTNPLANLHAEQLRTVTTDLLKINHPVMLAGMNVAAGPKLAAAVTNAGGLGVIGGVGYTPDMLREQIAELKGFLDDKNAPFGVDLLLPQVGGGARKTNYDYTKGKLNELVDIIIESNARLFVSAVGVPPKAIVDKLHQHNILYMNMIGHPKHVSKCLDVGADLICAQGGEGGGHTGDVPTSILIPTVAKMCEGKKSPLGHPVQVIAAGGIFNGQGLASALTLGASGVWVGTRFVLSEEAGAPKAHQEAVRTASFDDNVRTVIFTGRPLRVRNNPYITNWEDNRQNEIKELTGRGKIPVEHDIEQMGDDVDDDTMDNARPFLMGKASAVVNERKSARGIVDEMVGEAVQWLKRGASYARFHLPNPKTSCIFNCAPILISSPQIVPRFRPRNRDRSHNPPTLVPSQPTAILTIRGHPDYKSRKKKEMPSLLQSFTNLTPRTRILIGLGTITYATTAMYTTDAVAPSLGLEATEQDREEVKSWKPRIRIRDHNPEVANAQRMEQKGTDEEEKKEG